MGMWHDHHDGMHSTGQQPNNVFINDVVFESNKVLRRFRARLNKEEISATMSSAFPVNVSPDSRATTLIPGVAFSFCFCYGLVASSYGSKWSGFGCLSKEEMSDATVCLLVNGGFFYFDLQGQLCGVTAITVDSATIHTIEFGPGLRLGDDESHEMRGDLEAFWQPITLDFMLKKGATHYAWIRPGLTYVANPRCPVLSARGGGGGGGGGGACVRACVWWWWWAFLSFRIPFPLAGCARHFHADMVPSHIPPSGMVPAASTCLVRLVTSLKKRAGTRTASFLYCLQTLDGGVRSEQVLCNCCCTDSVPCLCGTTHAYAFTFLPT